MVRSLEQPTAEVREAADAMQDPRLLQIDAELDGLVEARNQNFVEIARRVALAHDILTVGKRENFGRYRAWLAKRKIGRRDAEDMVRIVRALVEERGLSPERVAKIGKTKARRLCSVVDSDSPPPKENADRWIAMAEDADISPDDFEERVSGAKARREITPDEGFVTRAYRMTEGQAQVLDDAVVLAKARLATESDGAALEAVGLEWCGTYAGYSATPERLGVRLAQRIEDSFGWKIIVLDPKTSTILYGSDVVNEVTKEGTKDA